MNTIILKFLFSFACFLGVISSYAQVPYFCVDKGAKLDYVKRCPDGEVMGYNQVLILDVYSDLVKGDTVGTIVYTANPLDDEGVPEAKKPMKITATYANGNLTVNMGEIIASMLSDMIDSALNDAEGEDNKGEVSTEEVQKKMGLEIKSEPAVFPSDIKSGDLLADVFFSVKVLWMTKRFSLTDRKVLREEVITTDAGTYSCVVVEEHVHERGMGSNKKYSVKTWHSRGVGAVRTETFSNRGRLESVEILSSLEI